MFLLNLEILEAPTLPILSDLQKIGRNMQMLSLVEFSEHCQRVKHMEILTGEILLIV